MARSENDHGPRPEPWTKKVDDIWRAAQLPYHNFSGMYAKVAVFYDLLYPHLLVYPTYWMVDLGRSVTKEPNTGKIAVLGLTNS